jgi:hypothetical protein
LCRVTISGALVASLRSLLRVGSRPRPDARPANSR